MSAEDWDNFNAGSKNTDAAASVLVATTLVGVSVSIAIESSCCSFLTGVAKGLAAPLLLPLALLGESFLLGLSFFVLIGVALVGLAARLVGCGVEVALSNAPGLLFSAPRSRSTLPPAPTAGLLNALAAAPDLAETADFASRKGVALAPSATTSLPHACSKAAKALEVSDSQGASSACRLLGVVFVLAAPLVATAAAAAAA